jgi:hypothetical protein
MPTGTEKEVNILQSLYNIYIYRETLHIQIQHFLPPHPTKIQDQ